MWKRDRAVGIAFLIVALGFLVMLPFMPAQLDTSRLAAEAVNRR